MTDEKTLCIVCAWRADCQKRFSFKSSDQRYCPDYSRDLAKPDPAEEDEEKQ